MDKKKLMFITLTLSSLALLAPGCGKVTLGTDAGPGGMCGNGTVEPPEVCDDGAQSAQCDQDCTPAECGDGLVNPLAGEQCDGPVPNGACDACAVACFDGFATCNEDQEPCSVNVLEDPSNCGGCGNVCPDGVCQGGECQGVNNVKYVFLSSWVGYPDFGGVFVADDMCQQMASQAGLPGVYRAWISDGNTWPSQRFQQANVPYVLPDGRVIADNWQDLTDGQLYSPIDLTEYGEPPQPWTGGQNCHGQPPLCLQTFTNTDPVGRGRQEDCGGWTSRGFPPTFTGGDSTFSSGEWTLRAAGFRCDYAARLYCFQQ